MITFDKGNYWQLTQVMKLYKDVIEQMNQKGLDQWIWGDYPNVEIISEDLSSGNSYLLFDDNRLMGAFVLNEEQAPEYKTIPWCYGTRPITMHRLVIHPDYQGRGIAKDAMVLIEDIARNSAYDSLRLDTYSKNTAALALYEKVGYRKSGQVYFRGKDAHFVCFETPLTPDCPLLPMPMVPAFRHGTQTPWGGEKLKEYNKSIPDHLTGESLEVSAIPGLVSHSLQGEGLDELLALHGEKLQGKAVKGPFPLLLKLLDAREPLSVQVHPDDSYANHHENGKLGKTEAWFILDAKPGAQLVYGIKQGTTKEALLAASKQGKAVEALLRRVPVKAGDVCFIPAGCVHAIEAGIVLYEIQQSSDVTYRFYDWDRTDDKGNKRELHLQKAIDVTDVALQPSPISANENSQEVATLLENPVFVLQQLNIQNSLALVEDNNRFRILTALDSIVLNCGDGASLISMNKGDTVLLPAACPPVTFKGTGRVLLSMPSI